MSFQTPLDARAELARLVVLRTIPPIAGDGFRYVTLRHYLDLRDQANAMLRELRLR